MRIRKLVITPITVLAIIPVFVACDSDGAPTPEATATAERETLVPENVETPTPELTPTPDPAPTETPVPPEADPEADDELPEGWTRTQARSNVFALPEHNSLVSFSIALPPGWEVMETWPDEDGARGWIAGDVFLDSGIRAFLEYRIGGDSELDLEQVMARGEHDISHPVIEGEEALLHLAKPFAIDSGKSVGIYFEHIPGAPSSTDMPSLSISGSSRGFNAGVLERVLTSVRYTELPDPESNVPQPEVVPGDDWVRTPARADRYSFTMMVPPGWEFTEGGLGDSLTGQLSNGEVTLRYDFGGLAGASYQPISNLITGRPTPPHLMWTEEIDGDTFALVKPVSDEPDEYGTTSVYVDFLSPPPVYGSFGAPRMGFFGVGLTGEQQELALAMFRTLEPEDGYPGAK